MISSKKNNLTRSQFASFCKELFRKFFNTLNIEDREKLYPHFQEENASYFINNEWEKFMTKLPATANTSLNEVVIHFVESIYEDRKAPSIGENLDFIILKSSTQKNRYAKVFTSFLRRKYEREYKPNKEKKIRLGGGKKDIDKYKTSIFLWYLGFSNFEQFINIYPESDDTDLIIEHQQRLFGRQNEWDKVPKKFTEGIWRLEATESESMEDNEKDNVLKNRIEEFKNVHKREIEYNARCSYWADIQVRHSKNKGFFIVEGLIFTNTEIEELDEWTIKGVGGFRSSQSSMENVEYLCFDFEMIPKEGIDSPRTFGYAMVRAFTNGKKAVFEGFYLGNRMRDPRNLGDMDFKYKSGLQISMGRVVLYQK